MLSTITGERGGDMLSTITGERGGDMLSTITGERGGDIHVSAVMNIIIYLQEYTHLIITASYIVLKLKMNIIVHDVYVC